MTGGDRQRFSIRVGRRSRPLLLLWGVRRHNAYVEVDGEIDAHFGFFRLSTPVSNVVGFRIERPWRWITAIGVRRGVRQGDVTFAGSPDGGVCLDFAERVRWGPFRVPRFYVSLDEPERFTAALAARGIPGDDAP